MSAQYTHRNGESTPPIIEGKFNFFGKRYGKPIGAKNIKVDVESHFGILSVMEDYPVGFEHYEGRWWGPK